MACALCGLPGATTVGTKGPVFSEPAPVLTRKTLFLWHRIVPVPIRLCAKKRGVFMRSRFSAVFLTCFCGTKEQENPESLCHKIFRIFHQGAIFFETGSSPASEGHVFVAPPLSGFSDIRSGRPFSDLSLGGHKIIIPLNTIFLKIYVRWVRSCLGGLSCTTSPVFCEIRSLSFGTCSMSQEASMCSTTRLMSSGTQTSSCRSLGGVHMSLHRCHGVNRSKTSLECVFLPGNHLLNHVYT